MAIPNQESSMNRSFGLICQIAEVLSDENLQNRTVRITGRLDRYDAQAALAEVSFQNASMVVETQLLCLDTLELKVGSMYQFIGETRRIPNVSSVSAVRLEARVARNVDGLDIDLFIQALEIKRRFIEKTKVAAP